MADRKSPTETSRRVTEYALVTLVMTIVIFAGLAILRFASG